MVVATEDKGHVKKGVKRKLMEGETTSPVPVIEGMSAAEVSMVRRLAGNDPLVRKKTVRKLRKWLTALAKKCPDTLETRKDVEPNFVRVWKALFYCMWMADKPLPQEQLAEQISELVGIFDGKPNTMLLFVEWFLRTMAREWSWIDRYRLDKFMMLVRRVLRKTFSVMSNSKWKAETLDGFLKIVRSYVFNHQKLAPGKGNSESFNMKKPVIEPTITCPIGLQIHLTDIYLEELAKVDAEKLNSSKILKLISPFVNELASNDDFRIIDEIKERVFHHLMKQSDVGMDYYEGLAEEPDSEDEFEDMDGLELEEGMEDEEMHENGNSEDDDGLDNDEDLNQDELNDSALDPRAGKVDVVLPQLDIDYAALAEKLREAGAGKLVKKKNRGLLYSLAHQFREIVQGKYPLALPEEEPNTPAIPKKEIKQATKRLVESEDNAPKIRLTKKQRRREAKKAAAAAAGQDELNDTQGSEDASTFLNDADLFDHVSDNYASYVHEQMEKESVPILDESLENEVNDENDEDMPPSPKVSKKQKKMEKEMKKEKKKYKTEIEFECDEMDSASKSPTLGEPDSVIIIKSKKSPSAKKVKKIRRISDSLTSEESPTSKNIMKTKNKDDVKSIKQHAQSLKSLQPQLLQSSSPATPINKKLKKVLESTPMKTPLGTPTLSSSAKKRVSFILARNSEHEATDYMSTISRSPAVPFDANKTPSSGPLLKTPVKKQPKRLSLKMSPRKTALDFF